MPQKWKPQLGDKVYRAESNGKQLFFEQYIVVKLTPKGFWYRYKQSTPFQPPVNKHNAQWSQFDSRRVSFTKKEALKQFRGRKRCYLKHLLRRLEQAEIDLALASGGVREPLPDRVPQHLPLTFAFDNAVTSSDFSTTTTSTAWVRVP